MLTIHKYQLKIDDTLQQLSIPEGGDIVAADIQGDALCLWAQVDTDEEFEARFFKVIGTGHVVPEHAEYLFTVHQPPFVWHIYEVYI